MRVENFVLPLNGEVFKSRSLWLRHWSKKEPAYENQELFPTFAKGCILATRIKIKHVYQRKGGGGGGGVEIGFTERGAPTMKLKEFFNEYIYFC